MKYMVLFVGMDGGARSPKTPAEARSVLYMMVNEEMKNGWKPQGGVSVTSTPGDTSPNFFYHQAMIKED